MAYFHVCCHFLPVYVPLTAHSSTHTRRSRCSESTKKERKRSTHAAPPQSTTPHSLQKSKRSRSLTPKDSLTQAPLLRSLLNSVAKTNWRRFTHADSHARLPKAHYASVTTQSCPMEVPVCQRMQSLSPIRGSRECHCTRHCLALDSSSSSPSSSSSSFLSGSSCSSSPSPSPLNLR